MAKSLSRHSGGIQMTEGSLYKNILLFSIPLIFSQLLQVLFNIADVAVVGKFSSAAALGSVGSTTTLVSLFTAFLIGLGNGVNVRVAQYLGARQEESTRNCVHTSLILCTLMGLLISGLCLLLATPLLELLKTKEDLLERCSISGFMRWVCPLWAFSTSATQCSVPPATPDGLCCI